MGFRIDQLYIHDNISSITSGELLIQNKAQEDASSLFFLGEYDGNNNETQRFLQQLINRLYIRFEQNTVQSAEKFIEALLQELNEFIPEILPKEKQALKKFHCVLAVGDKRKIHLSTYSRVKCLLVRNNGMFDAVNSAGDENNERAGIFSSTIETELKNGDKFLFCNENILNYIAKEKIKKALIALPPTSAIAHFSNLLETVPKSASFLGIVIEFQQTNPNENINFGTIVDSKETSRASLEHLVLSQKETDDILNPPGFFKKLLTSIEIIYQEIRDFIKSFNKEKKSNFKLADAKPKFNNYHKKLVVSVKNKYSYYLNTYQQLPKKNKIIIWSSLIILIFFIQNLAFAGQRQAKKREESLFQTNVQQINSLSNEIESALLYEDYEKAQEIYGQIEGLLSKLPQNSVNRIATTDQLKKSTDQLSNRVWLKQNLDSGKNVVIGLKEKIIGTAKTFSSLNNKTFVIAGEQNIIIANDNNVTTVTSTPVTAVYNLSDKASILMGKDNAYRCDDKNCSQLTWQKPTNLGDIKTVGVYLSRIYFLDANNNIYRSNLSANNINNPKIWNKNSINLDRATGMFVDTAIHLSMDNKIEKWSSGTKENELIIKANPELTTINQIIGGEKYKYIWLLDKNNKRLLAITPNKNKVVQQLFSDVLGQARTINIDENQKLIHVLTDENVVELNYKQFGK